MKFYDAARPLYLETDASGVWLGTRLLKVRDGVNCRHDEVQDNAALCPVAFGSKSLLSAEQCYSNIECKVLGILDGLEKFHYLCFRR